jgi:hypothetical protein
MPGRADFLVELRGFEMMASAHALARLAPPLLPVLSLNSVLRPASLPLTYARPAARSRRHKGGVGHPRQHCDVRHSAAPGIML